MLLARPFIFVRESLGTSDTSLMRDWVLGRVFWWGCMVGLVSMAMSFSRSFCLDEWSIYVGWVCGDVGTSVL